MVAAGRAHVENGKFSQNGLKMVLGYQGLENHSAGKNQGGPPP